MSEDEVLDFAGACAEAARRAEVDLLRAAYQWAVLHDRRPARSRRDSGGRAREGAAAAAATASPEVPSSRPPSSAPGSAAHYAAARLIADAQDLHHRHPQLWARVQAGEVRASYARHVRREDPRPGPRARRRTSTPRSPSPPTGGSRGAGSRPWSRPRSPRPHPRSPGRRRSGPPGAVREEAAGRGARDGVVHDPRRRRDHRPDRGRSHRGAEHLAETLPDAETSDRRDRVHALLLMANPGAEPGTDLADLLPDVQLYVHVYGHHDGEGIARVEGHGPVTEDWVQARARAPRPGSRVRPVLDLAGQAPVDAYEIPDRHRQAVHLMTPADTFPYASCTARDDAGGPHRASRPGRCLRGGQLRPDDHDPSPDQDPARGGRSSSPTPASTCGATPTARSTSSTTPAPADSRARPPSSSEPRRSAAAVELWHSPVDLELDYAA